MPRSKPVSNITLLLPPPSSNAASSSKTPLPPPAQAPAQAPAPSLEVLILAKKLALDRGQKFDLESYLTADQLEEYRTKYLGLPPRPPPEVKEEPAPTPAPASAPVTAPATPAGAATPDSTTPTPAKRVIKIPDLSHLHWKQRAKRLAEIAREQEMIDNGEIPEPTVVEEPVGKKGELTEKDREAIRGSASYWNSLLVQARKSRGPQWDFSTQLLQYDRRSREYWNHGQEPRPASPPRKEKKRELAEGDGEVEGGSPKKKRRMSVNDKEGAEDGVVQDKSEGTEAGEKQDGKKRERERSSSLHQSFPVPANGTHDQPGNTGGSAQHGASTSATTPSQAQAGTPMFGAIGLGRPGLPLSLSSASNPGATLSQSQSQGQGQGHGQGQNQNQPQTQGQIPSDLLDGSSSARMINPAILASLQQQLANAGGATQSQSQQQLAGFSNAPQLGLGQSFSASRFNPNANPNANPSATVNTNAPLFAGLNPAQLGFNPAQLGLGAAGLTPHGIAQQLGMTGYGPGGGAQQGGAGGPMLSGGGGESGWEYTS